jgi:hypothetical protein
MKAYSLGFKALLRPCFSYYILLHILYYILLFIHLVAFYCPKNSLLSYSTGTLIQHVPGGRYGFSKLFQIFFVHMQTKRYLD